MAKAGFYGVKVGKIPGIYTTWADCEAQVKGYPGAEYKKFKTEDEAKNYVGLNKSAEVDAKRVYEIETEPVAEVQSSTRRGIGVSDKPYAFVDGSFNADTGVYGYGGFLDVYGKRYVLSGHDNDAEMAAMRNVAGEIAGSMAAVQKAEELGLKDLTVLYDYKGIEEWATGNWKTKKSGTKAYADFMNVDERTVHITFQKVAGHTGIEGNEIADVMAKNAVGIALTRSQQNMFDSAMSSFESENKASVRNWRVQMAESICSDTKEDVQQDFELD